MGAIASVPKNCVVCSGVGYCYSLCLISVSVSLRAALCAYISAMGTASHERLGKFEEPKFEFLFC